MKKVFGIFMVLFFAFVFTANAVETNTPSTPHSSGDIGNFGVWATPNNQAIIIGNLGEDINKFQENFQRDVTQTDFVPVEARVAFSVIGALSRVAVVMERSLFGFISTFIAIMLLFWIGIEAYEFTKTGGKPLELAKKIAMKVMWAGIWIWIISHNPAEIFMYLMSPIIYVGSYFSDLILNAVTTNVGVPITDSCAAIHNYVAHSKAATTLISPDVVANMICMPTRISGFFYTCLSAGFKWMSAGIGTSAMTFFVGLTFVVLFMANIWKFAIMALGVIVKLFLGLLFLPFTALAQTVGGGDTAAKGIAADIFKKFAGLFKTVDLNSQFQRFIQAVIYFIALSVIIAICSALLSGVVQTDLAGDVPTITSDGFMTVLICGILVFYLASQAEKFAKEIGGNIDEEFGKKVAGDLKTMWNGTKKNATDIYKAVKKK